MSQEQKETEICRMRDTYSGMTLSVTAYPSTINITRATSNPTFAEGDRIRSTPTIQRLNFYLETAKPEYMDTLLDRHGLDERNLHEGKLCLMSGIPFPNFGIPSYEVIVTETNGKYGTVFDAQKIEQQIEANIPAEAIDASLHSSRVGPRGDFNR